MKTELKFKDRINKKFTGRNEEKRKMETIEENMPQRGCGEERK